jgi:hypothetical protein
MVEAPVAQSTADSPTVRRLVVSAPGRLATLQPYATALHVQRQVVTMWEMLIAFGLLGGGIVLWRFAVLWDHFRRHKEDDDSAD